MTLTVLLAAPRSFCSGVRVVGLTAGASAPPRLVEEVIAALAPVSVVERVITRETVRFTLPVAVRPS